MQNCEIIGYQPQYAKDFERLNIAWLEKYFEVEPYDAEVLANPDHYILHKGGRILLARCGQEIAGCIALMFHGDEIEITKMAVEESYQGYGLGKQLMQAALEQAEALTPSRIYLLTNARLEAANGLYERLGFQQVPLEEGDNERYARCNRRWIWSKKS